VNSSSTTSRSILWGCVKFSERWTPELMIMESSVGWALITLFTLVYDIEGEREGTHDSANEGIEDRSVMSNWMDDALSFSCLETKESRFSFRRPTAITWLPFSINFSARARPMPEVAPRTRTVLYGKDMLGRFGSLEERFLDEGRLRVEQN